MYNLLEKAITRKPITDEDIESELYELCFNEHSSCGGDCPIHEEVLSDEDKKRSFCPYFKDGKKMLKVLREISW